MSDDVTIPAFRTVPRTGVIFVTAEASRRGYRSSDPDWCNLGQGQPETGELPGAPPRLGGSTVGVGRGPYPCTVQTVGARRPDDPEPALL